MDLSFQGESDGVSNAQAGVQWVCGDERDSTQDTVNSIGIYRAKYRLSIVHRTRAKEPMTEKVVSIHVHFYEGERKKEKSQKAMHVNWLFLHD